MAKNREPEKPVASDTDSGEEEDEDASSEESGSDDSDTEPEQTQVAKKPPPSTSATQKKPQPQPSSKPQEQQVKQPSSSSSEEESGSDTESDTDGQPEKIKPVASKPMDDLPVSDSASRKSRSKFETPAKFTASNRPVEEKQTEDKETKKSKKKPEIESSEKKSNDDPKKLLFQRLWSEDDEIEILKGMIDYVAKKKSDPVADLSAFHDYIRENLHVDVSRTQLQDKIRRLKKKYENNKSKEKDGKNRTLSKPHEHKAYELSKKIWGNGGGKENEGEKVMETPKANGGSVRKTSVKRVLVNENDDAKDAKIAKVLSGERANFLPIPTLNSMATSVEDRIMKMGAELFEMGKGLEEEKEWKRLKVEELEVYMKQLEVRRAQSKLILDVLKSEDH